MFLFAQEAAEKATKAAAAVAERSALENFFFGKDAVFAWPMVTMALIGVGLVIWRIMLNMNAKTRMDEFLPAFEQRLRKAGVDEAINFCATQEGVIPKKLFPAGLEAGKQGLAAARKAMSSTMKLEILPELNFLLAPIIGIAKIATMVGLFGTVVSMIGTFTELAKPQTGNTKGVSKQAESIGLALFATALGLVTAIPLVFAHVMFKDFIARFEVQMEKSAHKLLTLMQAARNREAGPIEAANAPTGPPGEPRRTVPAGRRG